MVAYGGVNPMINAPRAIPETARDRTRRRPYRSASGEMMMPLRGRTMNPMAYVRNEAMRDADWEPEGKICAEKTEARRPYTYQSYHSTKCPTVPASRLLARLLCRTGAVLSRVDVLGARRE